MKQRYTLFTTLLITATIFTSCNNHSKNQEMPQEELAAQKAALADSALAIVDKMLSDYTVALQDGGNEFIQQEVPDYLLNPDTIASLQTKSQKTAALAFLSVDNLVMKCYGLDTEAEEKAIAQLLTALGLDADIYMDCNTAVSEKFRNAYSQCTGSGEAELFWRFQIAVLAEFEYILTSSSEAYNEMLTSKVITPEFSAKWIKVLNKVAELAPYDDEVASIHNAFEQGRVAQSDSEAQAGINSADSARIMHQAHRDNYIARRNSFLE